MDDDQEDGQPSEAVVMTDGGLQLVAMTNASNANAEVTTVDLVNYPFNVVMGRAWAQSALARALPAADAEFAASAASRLADAQPAWLPTVDEWNRLYSLAEEPR